MSAKPSYPRDMGTNPGWLVYDYEIPERRFICTQLDESGYNDASFLDHRLQPLIKGYFPVTFEELEPLCNQQSAQRQPASYIFQMGHCGSTLISRALAFTPGVLPLREPLILKTLAGGFRELGQSLSWLGNEEWTRLLAIGLRVLDRRFRDEQIPLIKANSLCNNLCEPVLSSNSSRRAVMLHVPLESYLAGMLKYKDKLGDIRLQSRTRLEEWHQVSGSTELELASLPVVELIVLSWVGSMQRFSMAEQNHPDQVMRLDFEDFLGQPEEKLNELADFLGHSSLEGQAANHFRNISGQYSKDPRLPYSEQVRTQSLNQSRSLNRSLINRGQAFAEELLAAYPVLSRLKAYF